MDGSNDELLQLADVLRLGIETAREIVKLRPHDASAIEAVIRQIADMIAQLEAMGWQPNGSHPVAT